MKVNDTQLILLTTASQRDNGSLLPLPTSLGNVAERAHKSIATLIKGGLAEEGEVSRAADAWRHQGDSQFGVRITASGLKTIGVEPESDAMQRETPPIIRHRTKSDLVLALLGRDVGATLEELTSATGWLPHTTRAAMTALRKKGYAIEKGERGNVTRWLIKVA